MIGLLVKCARIVPDECGIEFNKTTHNQKYCSPECCRISTNAKIMEKYHERAAIKRGKKRTCKECGVTELSRYNENKYCGSCETKMREAHRGEAAKLLATVSWL